ncbi:MAG: hypothetical protein BGO52_03815 [Sphingobacteriales bacterium 44-61]|nr:MAG: hypothetical protein BGO52_03815 [Sphingobacteriales bacterium 44-61]
MFQFALVLTVIPSCKKFIEIDPPVTSTNAEIIYEDNNSAISALTGIYANMSGYNSIFSGNIGMSLLCGLSADEFTLYDGVSDQKYWAYYTNTLVSTANQNYGSEAWTTLYNFVYTCNSAIDGLANAQKLTPIVKSQLLGEARFMRAFFYFYLTSLYGNVPLALSTDPFINAQLPRSGVSNVYEQIESDLTAATGLLSDHYIDATLEKNSSERVRPTKWAALTLLARFYLYTGQYEKANTAATSVINEQGLFNLPPLNETFLANSSEAIWQLQPVRLGRNTEDAFTFIIPSTGPSDVTSPGAGNPAWLSEKLLNSFEATDQRLTNWVSHVTVDGSTYFFPFKYKSATLDDPVTEYLMVFRLAELYLIRAEALAQLNDMDGAQSDLNMIRNRAGLPGAAATGKDELLTKISQERQVELFTEWGHRWFDLKRTQTINTIMPPITSIKGGQWQSTDQLYPLPYGDIQKNPKLIQNDGYN